ncbi:hypothetical protein [Brevundimonas diminuta]|nr:hypothetical protein [Brevundimonas diminuta]
MTTKRDDRFADLNERISRLEQKAASEIVVQQRPPKPPAAELSEGEKQVRVWVRRAVLAWGLLIWALMVFQGWGRISTIMIIMGFFFAIAISLAIYAINLAYWDFGKRAARRLMGRNED